MMDENRSRVPLKAFGNWRAKFKAEPQPLERKLLYRRSELGRVLIKAAGSAMRESPQGLVTKEVSHYRPRACVYRKPKPGRSGDEVRQGSRVN